MDVVRVLLIIALIIILLALSYPLTKHYRYNIEKYLNNIQDPEFRIIAQGVVNTYYGISEFLYSISLKVINYLEKMYTYIKQEVANALESIQ